MINLQQFGPPTRVALTLTEGLSCGATDPVWMFLITNELTGATVSFISEDISASPGRFNEFIWQSVGPTAQDLQDGKFYAADPGQWSYDAYQMPTGSTSLDPLEAVGLAETGTLTLIGATPSLPSFSNGPAIIPTFDDPRPCLYTFTAYDTYSGGSGPPPGTPFPGQVTINLVDDNVWEYTGSSWISTSPITWSCYDISSTGQRYQYDGVSWHLRN